MLYSFSPLPPITPLSFFVLAPLDCVDITAVEEDDGLTIGEDDDLIATIHDWIAKICYCSTPSVRLSISVNLSSAQIQFVDISVSSSYESKSATTIISSPPQIKSPQISWDLPLLCCWWDSLDVQRRKQLQKQSLIFWVGFCVSDELAGATAVGGVAAGSSAVLLSGGSGGDGLDCIKMVELYP
ncbi:hypothetical protein TB2_007805 [Malus domestica]